MSLPRGRPRKQLSINATDDEIRKYNRMIATLKWRTKNKEKVSEYNKTDWYKQSKQKYNEKNPEKVKQAIKDWIERNKERLNTKVLCETCQHEYQYRHRSLHIKRKYHITAMKVG